MEVIRHAEANGKLSDAPAVCGGTIETLQDLCDAIAVGEPVAISDAMGRCAIDMIRLCAMLDIDLSKCLEQAFEKISAKPKSGAPIVAEFVPSSEMLAIRDAAIAHIDQVIGVPSNVVFLKKE
jgi:NTP pyrophosphatase (non-canonical NTP hydrolase)